MKTISGKKYIYDGRGYVEQKEQPVAQEEHDPVYVQERENLVRKEEMSLYAKKTDVTGEHIETVYRADAVYVGDAIQVENIPGGHICDVKRLMVRTSWGDVQPQFSLTYDAGKALLQSPALSKAANWEFFTIEYNTVRNDKTYIPDLRGRIGRNYMQDEDSGNQYHSDAMIDVFKSVYAQLGGTARQALSSIKLQGGSITQNVTDEAAAKYGFNIIARPYFAGAQEEEISSCADILTVGSHYGNFHYAGAIEAQQHGKLSTTLPNTGDRRDITAGPDVFLRNTIAVTAGQNTDGTGLWATYGNGVEFFEAYSKEVLDVAYPARNIYRIFTEVYTAPGRVLMSDTHTRFAGNLPAGTTMYIHYSDTNIVEAVVSEILSDKSVRIDRDVPAIAKPGKYGFMYMCIADMFAGKSHQSPTCSIVAAKLALIQDQTDAPWQLVREAARMTASNSTVEVVSSKKVYTTHWDMKRGFGIIDVAKAVEYIRDNYTNNKEYIDSAVAGLPRANPLLKIADLDDDNYISKKMLEEVLRGYKKI